MKIGICDDNPQELEQLKKIIQSSLKEGDFLEGYTNGFQLLDSNAMQPYDLLILDIKMPYLSGIQVAKEIRLYSDVCQIILLTMYREYGPESYKVRASDYILKPIQSDKVLEAMQKARERYMINSEFIRLETKQNIHFLYLKDILFFESNGHHIYAHTTDGVVQVSNTLRALQTQLEPKGFYRAHNSYLINMSHVRQISGREVWIGAKILPIGSSRHATDLGRAVTAWKLAKGE